MTNLHQILHRPPHQLKEGSYTSMFLPTKLPDLRVPQTPKPKQSTGEKTLLYKKCPDG